MPKITVTIEEMSLEEAKAWLHALMDKYGTDLAVTCLKEREARFANLTTNQKDQGDE